MINNNYISLALFFSILKLFVQTLFLFCFFFAITFFFQGSSFAQNDWTLPSKSGNSLHSEWKLLMHFKMLLSNYHSLTGIIFFLHVVELLVVILSFTIASDWGSIETEGPLHCVLDVQGFPAQPFGSGTFQNAFKATCIEPNKFLDLAGRYVLQEKNGRSFDDCSGLKFIHWRHGPNEWRKQ